MVIPEHLTDSHLGITASVVLKSHSYHVMLFNSRRHLGLTTFPRQFLTSDDHHVGWIFTAVFLHHVFKCPMRSALKIVPWGELICNVKILSCEKS